MDGFNTTNFIITLIIQAIHMNGSISNFNVTSQNIMYFDVGGVSVFRRLPNIYYCQNLISLFSIHYSSSLYVTLNNLVV